jgi:hypothetical protein
MALRATESDEDAPHIGSFSKMAFSPVQWIQ